MPNNESQSPEEIAKKYHNASRKKQKRVAFGYARTPSVFQMEVSECGAAALSMILQYYGKYVAMEELRVETGVSRNGVNAKNIFLAGEHYGMKVEATSRSLDRMLRYNKPPCMIHWNYSHFVVFEGVKGRHFYINDPQLGHRKLTKQEMLDGFSGTVLQFTPTKDFVKSKSERTLINFMKKRLRGQKMTLAAIYLLGVALILPGILNSMFFQIFADDIIIDAKYDWTKWLLITMALTALYDAYFSYIQNNLQLMLRIKMSLLSTDSMIGHMLRLPMSFFEQRYAGDLVQRITNNAAVSNFLSGQLVGLLVSLCTSIFYLMVMMLYSPILALIGLAFSTASVSIAVVISKRIYGMAMKFGMDNGKLMGALYNGLTANASLKAVGAEYDYTSKVLGYYTEVNINDQRLGYTQAVLDVIPRTLSSLNTVAVLVAGSLLVIDGKITAGMIMSFTGFLGSFSGPFEHIVSFVRSIQQIKNDASRVEDIMNYEEDEYYNSTKETSLEGSKLKGEIELRDISFAYGKLDKPFIKNFNFHVNSGQTVALVGSSGCGKSTVSKLLSCLYKPWSGEILLDGHELSEIPQSVINSSIAVVTQEVNLFDASIYDNITTWNQTIHQEEVISAAKDACLHDEISAKPGGYDYKLKEGGANMSGGQRQRIEIARALAVNPTILVLDEATSALDATTEKRILDNIKKRNCTCVVVAQRLSTIRDCDEIIVMQKGLIKERGTHEELLEANGLYKKLVSEAD